jgi:hypothetical protein
MLRVFEAFSLTRGHKQDFAYTNKTLACVQLLLEIMEIDNRWIVKIRAEKDDANQNNEFIKRKNG